MIYDTFSGTLDEAFQSLAAGQIRSLRVRPGSAEIAWILVFAPHFRGDVEGRWTVVIEHGAGNAAAVFDRIVAQPDLEFVVASVEETQDAPPVGPGAEAFAWDHPWLVAAAVPGEPGPLGVRPGPAFRLLHST